ncbi:Heme-degrading monooxygenase HmoA [Salinihabitans flavidus]|uniref:Heme-degrading monooxygenase HmoA n=1 Tax=Salinihabitans flavidus TaxID=569882 RepID=A0A1H8UHP5_9RHOB|nr:antibiotic biosynthesis monooxygenase family protein [Salinihabitans flavidus]SEP02752.1 Heme-degrading monooxygenase HmoA [Salinihabitans flavidus]
MHALFFEVRPHPGHLEHYFEHVDRLRPVLARHEGLLFLDRYSSLNEPDLLLSHQLWDSEDAIVAWRADSEHRRSQSAGRRIHFADYRIRVGARVRHWQAGETKLSAEVDAAPDRSHVLALYGTQPVKASGFESFESVNHKGRFISLTTADGFGAANAALHAHTDAPGVEEAAVYSIRRDYGQFDRAQAPG